MSSNCKVLSISPSKSNARKIDEKPTVGKSAKTRRKNKKDFEKDPVARSAYCGAYSSEEDRMIIGFVNKGKPLTTLHLPGRTIHGIYGRLQRLRKEGKIR
jgi:hypothetical protein